MKVKLLVSRVGANFSQNANQEIEVSDAEAERLVASDQAVYLPGQEPDPVKPPGDSTEGAETDPSGDDPEGAETDQAESANSEEETRPGEAAHEPDATEQAIRTSRRRRKNAK